MRCAIICPGPSAETLPDLEGYDARIAVNRAAQRIEADYWLFLDSRAYRITQAIGCPAIVTSRLVWHELCRRIPDLRERPFKDCLFDGRRDVLNKAIKWGTFSGTAALVFAAELGASQIDVFGADMAGDADFSGQHAECRDAKRWSRERSIWHAVRDELSTRDIAVRRLGVSDGD